MCVRRDPRHTKPPVRSSEGCVYAVIPGTQSPARHSAYADRCQNLLPRHVVMCSHHQHSNKYNYLHARNGTGMRYAMIGNS